MSFKERLSIASLTAIIERNDSFSYEMINNLEKDNINHSKEFKQKLEQLKNDLILR